ncbi:hypothetical protein MVES1_000660 [Malassezia vespertilionis]|uniref:uncharacterized protein n=1 Tax=Malassezia vespertilionis TaxID=2020962 RepID=UPI0024B06902|nr:uncharacterized protein MVES1_000660 [Malassezia vespertilionis]WFD05330.1 hypothetical protein MVES1_000660 [Malassezia vespertilionis]
MTWFQSFAGLSGASAVICGTATQYQLVHSIALLYVSSHVPLNGAALVASYAFATGMTLFSGSIYALCLLPQGHGARKVLGPSTPIGGLCMIAGWLALAYARRPGRLL